MNAPIVERERGHRTRSAKEIENDLQMACRGVGALAGGARLTGNPINRCALRNTLEGIRRLLAEPAENAGERNE